MIIDTMGTLDAAAIQKEEIAKVLNQYPGDLSACQDVRDAIEFLLQRPNISESLLDHEKLLWIQSQFEDENYYEEIDAAMTVSLISNGTNTRATGLHNPRKEGKTWLPLPTLKNFDPLYRNPNNRHNTYIVDMQWDVEVNDDNCMVYVGVTQGSATDVVSTRKKDGKYMVFEIDYSVNSKLPRKDHPLMSGKIRERLAAIEKREHSGWNGYTTHGHKGSNFLRATTKSPAHNPFARLPAMLIVDGDKKPAATVERVKSSDMIAISEMIDKLRLTGVKQTQAISPNLMPIPLKDAPHCAPHRSDPFDK